MSASTADETEIRAAFDRLLRDLRPKLHRYCARMTGSVIDAEDIVQEAIVKAIEAFPQAGSIANAEGWLIRIAHNTALDFLRRRARQEAIGTDEDPEMVVDPVATVDDRLSVATSLRTFMRLPVAQRSSVILMDVLGYSLGEVSNILDNGIPAVKAALHRGRVRPEQRSGAHLRRWRLSASPGAVATILRMAAVPIQSGGDFMGDVPAKPIVLEEARLISE